MLTGSLKPVIFLVWGIAVILVAFFAGVTSASNWLVVACAAVVPPVVVGQFWRAPAQTMSERIHEARR